MRPHPTLHAGLRLAVLAVALLLAGCGRSAPTDPAAPTQETFTLTSNPLPIVRADLPAAPGPLTAFATNDSGPSLGCPADSTTLIFGCAGWVYRDSLVQFGACRYRLRVPPGAVLNASFILLRYYASSWIEVQVKTMGDTLQLPLELEIDLSGTNVDPGAPNFDQSNPRAFAYHEASDTWERLPGAYDPATRKLTAQVTALGRVAVGSKAGW